MPPAPRCTTHPSELAGWRCRECGAWLCPACTVVLRVAGTDSDGCARCRGLAERLRLPRREARPFGSRIPGAFLHPANRNGALSILALALVVRALQLLGALGAFLASGVLWAFLFGVIVQGSRGKETLEPPDFSHPLDDLILPALRGVLATALLWVPATLRAGHLLAQVVPGRDDPTALVSVLVGDPVIWLLLLGGVAFLPAALVAAAVTRSFLAVVNPLFPIQMARILGKDYLRVAATTTGLGVAALFVERAAWETVGRLPFVGGVLAVAAGAYLPIVNARILGLLLHVRGDELGLGDPGDFLDPVLPGAAPSGGVVALEPAPRRPRAAEPPSDGPPPVAVAVPVREQPAPTSGEELRAALAAGDLARAYALYRQEQGRCDGLGAGDLFQIARGAAQAGDHPVAAWALRSAAAFDDDPVVPDALLVLGRIYRARLGKGEEARQTFELLLARYPESDAAGHARAELAKGS